jgi:hypothetical protein
MPIPPRRTTSPDANQMRVALGAFTSGGPASSAPKLPRVRAYSDGAPKGRLQLLGTRANGNRTFSALAR